MSDPREMLCRARQALIEGRPGDCSREIETFERVCMAGTVPAEVLEACALLVAELRALAAACLEGASAARAALGEAIEAAGQLTTYSANGARAHAAPRPRSGNAY